MADYPAIRKLSVLMCLSLLGCFRSGTSAQIIPFAPISPTEAKECQEFSAKVEAYAADYTNQHEKCLAENKADNPNEPPNSQICSRTRCQYLHDMLYSDYMPGSAKT